MVKNRIQLKFPKKMLQILFKALSTSDYTFACK